MELLQDMVDICATETTRIGTDLAAALESGDGNAAADAAHGLKGMFANLSAPRATELASQAEHAARSGDLSQVARLWETLLVEIGRVQSYLEKEI